MFSEVSSMSNVSYKGIFDQSIYDQDEYLKTTPVAQVTDSGLIDCLMKKKIKRLNDVVLKNLTERMKQYETVLSEGKNRRLISLIARAVPFIGNLPDSYVKEFTLISKEEAQKEAFKLSFQLQALEQGITKEPICDLEIKYILLKRKISSPTIRDQIEKALLMSREEAIYIEFVRKFIDNCLSMPHSTLKVTLTKSLSDDEFFKNFDPVLLDRLEEIVTKLSFDSVEGDNVIGNKRSIYYFYGEPGTGKSETAVRLAEFTGLPYFVVTIRRLEDLSCQALEGAERTHLTHSPGLLATTLMSKNKQGQSYKNAILIINDFDRILFADGGPGVVSTSLSFLLDYLDPEKTGFYGPYFNEVLDISRLSIFITANRPIPKNDITMEKNAFDAYAALRSRVAGGEIHFPNFPQTVLQKMLLPFAENLLRKYKVTKSDTCSSEDFIKEAINRLKASHAGLEPRDLKRQLETLIIAYKRGKPLAPLPSKQQTLIPELSRPLKDEKSAGHIQSSVLLEAKPAENFLYRYWRALKEDKLTQAKLKGAAATVAAFAVASAVSTYTSYQKTNQCKI